MAEQGRFIPASEVKAYHTSGAVGELNRQWEIADAWHGNHRTPLESLKNHVDVMRSHGVLGWLRGFREDPQSILRSIENRGGDAGWFEY